MTQKGGIIIYSSSILCDPAGSRTQDPPAERDALPTNC
jgi:hypothetical protein